MNNFNMSDTRSRRNLLNWTGIFPFQPISNYSSDSIKIKMDIKNSIGENLFLNNLHLVPDPLKKNLADSIISGEVKTKTNMASERKTFVHEPKMKGRNSENHHTDFSPPLGSITNFLSGVINFVSSAMFLKRTDSPTQYYESYEQNFDEMAPSLQAWHLAKSEVQNKNGRAHNVISSNEATKVECSTMNSSCRIAAAKCENNLNQVHIFLQNQHLQYQSQLHSDSPKMYVEQSSIEDCYEDAFSCEDFETFSDQCYFEDFGPFSCQKPELLVSDAPRMKTDYLPLTENMEITSTLPDVNKESAIITDNKLDNNVPGGRIDPEPQIVEACEDKMNKLKALLQEKRKNKSKNEINTLDDNIVIVKNNEKHTKPIVIPNSNSNMIMKNSKEDNSTPENDVFWNKSEDEDVLFLKSSIDDQDGSDSCPEYLDPSNYFNEVTGKFCSTSVDSDDSFQIVFTDSPKSCRGRIPSECESEDSFIVFEDSPDSCYSSKDVFGDEIYVTGLHEIESSSDSDSEEECDDSDLESDSGCDAFNQTCKLSHSLTRTIGDLTDDSLYNIDEVDCAAVFLKEKMIENTSDAKQVNANNTEGKSKNSGRLLDEKRKLEKKKLPKKSVRFSEKPPKVHVMHVWAFAARQARAGHWERHALDRERFKRRIADVEMAVSWVLKPQHRSRVMFQRFMPWWNAQKRKELAENERKKEEEEKEIRDAETNGMYDAEELHSESDIKEDEVKIENNFETYNGDENVLDTINSIQMSEKPNCTYEEEILEKNVEKTDTPKRIPKNGQILMNGQITVNGNNKNVLKFGFEDNIENT